ncbi:LOW QUALITY PROTEIN: MTNR1B isoform 3, partial [Pongo abelii]
GLVGGWQRAALQDPSTSLGGSLAIRGAHRHHRRGRRGQPPGDPFRTQEPQAPERRFLVINQELRESKRMVKPRPRTSSNVHIWNDLMLWALIVNKNAFAKTAKFGEPCLPP